MKKAVFVMFLAVLVVCPVWGWLPDANANDKIMARPGESDPVNSSHRSLFRDDELFFLIGDPQVHKGYFGAFTPDKPDLSQWSDEERDHTYLSSEYALINGDPPAWSSDVGRITEPQHDQVAYAFYRPDGDVELELWDYTDGRHGPYIKLDGTTDLQSVAVVTGDLDMLVDSDNYYHDEIIVARIANGNIVKVSVVDHHFNILDTISISSPDELPMPIKVQVAVGDLDLDGSLEVVVGQQRCTSRKTCQESKFQLNVLRFTKDKDEVWELKEVSTTTYAPSYAPYLGFSEVFDMTAGDFNGDGKEDVAVAGGGCIDLFNANSKLELQRVKQYKMDNGYMDPYDQMMTAGLFKFDPINGYGPGRRQLALFIADSAESYIRMYSVRGNWEVDELGKIDYDFSLAHAITGITAGNFVGHDGKLPLEDIAISYTGWDGHNHIPTLKILGIRSDKLEELYRYQHGGLGGYVSALLEATDNDGDTYRLGTPAHIVLDSHLAMDYVLQEPPKHVDYLPVDPDDPHGDWKVFNISAYNDFIVELKDDKDTSLETSATNTASSSIGGSKLTDVGATVSGGFGDIVKAEADIDVKNKVSYGFQAEESQFNSHYASRSVSYSNQTNIDDNLHAKHQTIDIWRYVMYSLMTKDNKHGVYEVVLPGPEIIVAGGGKNFADWYQPLHQNRNALSYPHFVAEQTNYNPPDLGSFTLPNGTSVEGLMNEEATHYWDGNAHTLKISWTEKAGSGETKSYKHTLSESTDVTVGEKAEASFLEGGVEAHASVNVSFDSSCSWGGSNTETATNSKSRGVTIQVPSEGGGVYGYAFQSAVYISSGHGAFKVAHATDPMGGQGSDWWKQQYALKPDPALNLPNRFINDSKDQWSINTENSRKRMRGFLMKYYVKNPLTHKNDILSSSPVDGDKVKLCARVYNYGLFNPTGNFKVSFYGIVFDNENAREVGDLFKIGELTANLDSIAKGSGSTYYYPDNQIWQDELCVDWDTTGLSDTVIDGKYYNTYRLYVIIDEDDEVKNEIHEWKDANGNKLAHGNNEGYWPWKNAIQVISKASLGETLSEIDISLNDDSLGIERGSGLESQGPIEVTLGKTYDLRVRIHSTGSHPHYRYILFYEGDPKNGGRVFSSRRVFGIPEGDSYVWTEWTPQEEGTHDVWVKVLEDSDNPKLNNNTDTLGVEVVKVKAGDSWFQNVILEME